MAISDLTSLISHWKLNEESGDRADAHGAHTLTDHNTVLFGTGILGNAADLEAANTERLSKGVHADFGLGADEDYTWAVWVKMESKPGNDMFILHGASSPGADDDILFAVRWEDVGDRFEFMIGDGTNSGIEAADNLGAPSLATWYLIIAWHDKTANTINIQVNDGTVDSSAWANGTNANATGSVEFGWHSWAGTQLWDGLFDSMSYWRGRVLSSAERTELYNLGAGIDYPFTVGVTFAQAVIIA